MSKQIKLNIGCGIHHYKGFINVDKYLTKDFLLEQVASGVPSAVNVEIEKGSTYVQGDMMDLPFQNNYADYIESVDTIEHIPFRQVETAIKEMYRVLKPGGVMKLFTTNFSDLAQRWVDEIKDKPLDLENYMEQAEVLYGNQVDQGNFHTAPITKELMTHLTLSAGFKEVMIGLFPRGCTELPPLETQKAIGAFYLRSGCIYVEATK